MNADKELTANFDFTGGPLVSLAINCGGSAYTASDGTIYSTDINYSGGSVFSNNASVSNTADDKLYQSERYGNMSYNFDLPNGIYNVTLMFAEIYHEEAGKRIFDVSIEGKPLINNLDIYAKAGYLGAYNETHTVALEDGKMSISFQTLTDNAKISAIKITPAFEGNAYSVGIQALNGSVSLNPPGISFMEGSRLTATATPDIGYIFSGWTGDISGSDNPVSFVIDTNKIVIANFVKNPNFILSWESINGSVTLDPPGGEYNEGTVVTITAIPFLGYKFSNWEGDLSGTMNPMSIKMNADKNVIAKFIPIPNFSLKTNTTNGFIFVYPSATSYKEGSKVSLRAIPATGYEFVEWSGDLTGSANPDTIIMDGNKNVTAVFEMLTSVNNAISIPSQDRLDQNYPNPFATTTTIPYQIKKASKVKLSVYNSFGQLVTILVNEYQAAGFYEMNWSGKDTTGKQVASGLYMFQLETGSNAIQLKRACLIKH